MKLQIRAINRRIQYVSRHNFHRYLFTNTVTTA